MIICFSIPFWVYSILSDFSKSGNTLGKKILKIQVVTLKKERLRLYQAIFRTFFKLIPWELINLAFFGLSENWARLDNFSIAQITIIIIAVALILTYLIFVIKMKGVRGVHDIISQTQIIRRSQS